MTFTWRPLLQRLPHSPTPSPKRPLPVKLASSRAPKSIILTFDAFGTLVCPRRPIAEQYLDAARKSGLAVQDIAAPSLFASFKQSFKQLDDLYPNYGQCENGLNSSREWWNRVVWNTFAPFITLPEKVLHASETLFPLPHSREYVDEELHANAKKLEETCHILWERFHSIAYTTFSDVKPLYIALQELKAKYAKDVRIIVGVISNSDHRIKSVMESLGLYDNCHWAKVTLKPTVNRKPMLLDFIITSAENGYLKPDPIIFRSALNKAILNVGYAPSRLFTTTIHVGDDATTDVRGAIAAGWDCSVLLQRDRTRDEAIDTYQWRIGSNDEQDAAEAGNTKKSALKVVRSLEAVPRLVEREIRKLQTQWKDSKNGKLKKPPRRRVTRADFEMVRKTTRGTRKRR